jgi:hypothetical protein
LVVFRHVWSLLSHVTTSARSEQTRTRSRVFKLTRYPLAL